MEVNNFYKDWYTGSEILKCNAMAREDGRCMVERSDPHKLEAWGYYSTLSAAYYLYVDIESCVLDVWFPGFEDQEDDVESDDSDFAIVVSAVLINAIF